MTDGQALSEPRIQLDSDQLKAAYRRRRMAGDKSGAEALALLAVSRGMLRSVDLVTGKYRERPLDSRELGRLMKNHERRWSRWLAEHRQSN